MRLPESSLLARSAPRQERTFLLCMPFLGVFAACTSRFFDVHAIFSKKGMHNKIRGLIRGSVRERSGSESARPRPHPVARSARPLRRRGPQAPPRARGSRPEAARSGSRPEAARSARASSSSSASSSSAASSSAAAASSSSSSSAAAASS